MEIKTPEEAIKYLGMDLENGRIVKNMLIAIAQKLANQQAEIQVLKETLFINGIFL